MSYGPVDVAVTGAAGFVGRALCRRLSVEGRTVQGLDLRAADLPTVHLDVTKPEQVREVFGRLKPRVVVHGAALVDDRGAKEAFERVNVGGTRNVLEAAIECGVERFVQISSIAALGFDPGPMADEQTPLGLHTGAPYFDTKAASEQLVRRAHAAGRVAAVVVRPGDVFGPGSEPWVNRPLEMMRQGLPVLIGGGRGLIAHCWIDNLVDGLCLAIDHGQAPGGIFQFHDGAVTTSYADYFRQLAAIGGIEHSLRGMPKALALGIAHAAELTQRLTGRPAFLTRGAVHYVCRGASYALTSSRELLGYEPKGRLSDRMVELAQHLGDR